MKAPRVLQVEVASRGPRVDGGLARATGVGQSCSRGHSARPPSATSPIVAAEQTVHLDISDTLCGSRTSQLADDNEITAHDLSLDNIPRDAIVVASKSFEST